MNATELAAALHKIDYSLCCKCGSSFNEISPENEGTLSFYTIVEKCRIKRVCPKCFPEYSHLWMR
jgi:hypothetical protein